MTSTNPAIHEEHSQEGLLLRGADLASLLLGFYVASLNTPAWQPHLYYLAVASAVAIYLLVGEVTGLYRNWRGVTSDRELACAALTWGYTLAALLVLGFLTKETAELSRKAVLMTTGYTLVFLCAARVTMRMVQQFRCSTGANTRKIAIVGVNKLGIQLARNLIASPQVGLSLQGFYDDRGADRTGPLPTDCGEQVGSIAELVAAARRGEVQRIYITFPMRAEERIRSVLNELADSTASVYIVPDFFVFELLHSRWTDINGLPAVSVFENPFYGVDGLLKRTLDLVLASIALLLLAIPMAVIALLVKRSSPGPVFFRQLRYGLDGRSILVWKFRSMGVCENGDTVTQATKNDPRVTPIGAILRRTSLDEIPQLFNVLAGSMSLVGPRPHANAHNEHYRSLIPGYMLRHKVKPGITGWAQVNGWRGETDTLEKMEKRIECDHQYIRQWSLGLDIEILFRTVLVVFSRKNAY